MNAVRRMYPTSEGLVEICVFPIRDEVLIYAPWLGDRFTRYYLLKFKKAFEVKEGESFLESIGVKNNSGNPVFAFKQEGLLIGDEELTEGISEFFYSGFAHICFQQVIDTIHLIEYRRGRSSKPANMLAQEDISVSDISAIMDGMQ